MNVKASSAIWKTILSILVGRLSLSFWGFKRFCNVFELPKELPVCHFFINRCTLPLKFAIPKKERIVFQVSFFRGYESHEKNPLTFHVLLPSISHPGCLTGILIVVLS